MSNKYDEFLSVEQKEWLQISITCIEQKRVSLLQLVEDLRPKLIAREADVRANGVNQLCALILKLADSEVFQIDAKECDFLLDYLLIKVEDSGHLADLLIFTIHHLLTLHYDGKNRLLQNEQFDKILSALFENNGVQSYGKRDRIHLFTILEHLFHTHFEQLHALGPQRFTMAFIQSAQGEREPLLLFKVLGIHQKVASRLELGVIAEDMFEMIACYFPLDYEPDMNNKGPLISREMLLNALNSSLVANARFAPFCFQLIAEKLVEINTEMGAVDNTILISKQLEICEFLTIACKKFDKYNYMDEHNFDDVATGIRLIFMNPAQNAKLLERTTLIIFKTLKAMAKLLTKKQTDQDKVTGQEYLRKLTAATIENIEPFILQAEMGTMGKAFRLLWCLACCNKIALDMVVPRALYWLNVLIDGHTLRSPQNREEIALEAMELLPGWIYISVGMFPLHFGNSSKALKLESKAENELMAKAAEELMNNSIIPLLAAIFAFDASCLNKSKLFSYECRTFSTLLLSICTQSPCDLPYVNHFRKLLQQSDQIQEFCQRIIKGIFSSDPDDEILIIFDEKVPQRCDAVKQFLALYTICNYETVQQYIDSDDSDRNVQILSRLLPAFIHPLSIELEGRELLAEFYQKAIMFMPTRKNILFKIVQEIVTNSDRKTTNVVAMCATAIVEISQRMIDLKNEQIFSDEFLQPLVGLLEQFDRGCHSGHHLQQWFNYHADSIINIRETITTTTWRDSAHIDLFAAMLQDIGEQLLNNKDGYAALHASLCDTAILRCVVNESGDDNICRCRFYWLLLLQCKSYDTLIHFIELLCILLENHINKVREKEKKNSQSVSSFMKNNNITKWLLEALFWTCFAVANRWNFYLSDQTNDNKAEDQTNMQFQFQNLFNSKVLRTLIKALGKSQAHFRISILNARLQLFNQRSGTNALQQFFVKYLDWYKNDAIEGDAHNSWVFLSDLIEFSRRSSDPEKCFYRTTHLWRQRIFCQLVSSALYVFNWIKQNENDEHFPIMLQLTGQLLKLGAQVQPVDAVFNEFVQLTPIIVEAVIASKEFEWGRIPTEILLKIFDCLELIAVRCRKNANNDNDGNISGRQQFLAVLYPKVVRACSLMAAHKKRPVRQRVSFARNAWEQLMLAP